MFQENHQKIQYRSPFRYPGGKTWLVPYVRCWLNFRDRTPRVLIEPFAGGGTIALTAVFENLAQSVIMVERDESVAAVWKAMLNGHGDWLAKRIAGFKLSKEAVLAELKRSPRTIQGKAFQTLLRNRVSRGGIMAPGSGLINRGENGKGIGSRWYPETLKKRIEDIVEIKGRVKFIEGDALQVLQQYRRWSSAVFFIDPPYISASRNRLYTYSAIDHAAVFRAVARVAGDILMTYDNVEEARRLADQHGFETMEVSMKNAHHSQMRELLIGRDLSWTAEVSD